MCASPPEQSSCRRKTWDSTVEVAVVIVTDSQGKGAPMSEAALVPGPNGTAYWWKASIRPVLKAWARDTSRKCNASNSTTGFRSAHPLGRAQKRTQPMFADQAIQ